MCVGVWVGGGVVAGGRGCSPGSRRQCGPPPSLQAHSAVTTRGTTVTTLT